MEVFIKKLLKDPVIVVLLILVPVLAAAVIIINANRMSDKNDVPQVTAPPVETAVIPDDNGECEKVTLETVLASAELCAGSWDVFALDLTDGESAAIGTTGEPMVSASLIKLFIMAAVYDRFADENGDLGSIYDDVSIMIRVSDNDAANRLTLLLGDGNETAGRQAVTDFARSVGCEDTIHNRLMLVSNGTENYTTAADCARLLKLIYDGSCVSPVCSRRMLNIMSEQYYSNGLDKLPEGAEVFHKTGNLTLKVCGDAGIIKCNGRSWILCAICNYQPSEQEPQNSIAALSGNVFEYITLKQYE